MIEDHRWRRPVDVPPRALVLGAGIVGAATAFLLQRRGLHVTVVAETFGTSTPGVVVPPAWEWPRSGRDTDGGQADVDARAERWAAETYRGWMEVTGRDSGVEWRRNRVHLDPESDRDPVERRRRDRLHEVVTEVARDDLRLRWTRSGPRRTASYHFVAPVIDPARLVVRLTTTLVERGAAVRRRRVVDLPDLTDLATEHRADVVVNCTGSGAGTFTGDPLLRSRPVMSVEVPCADPPAERRCAVVRDASGVSTELSATPLDGRLVLCMVTAGRPAPLDPLMVLDLCASTLELGAFLPEVPCRVRIGTVTARRGGGRVEAQELGTRLLVHNYGHGAASLSVLWGAAGAAAALAVGAVTRSRAPEPAAVGGPVAEGWS